VPALPFLDRGEKPLSTRALVDGGTVAPDAVFELAKAHDATMVDLKFTDLPGTWQHMGMALSTLEADSFSEGIGFDGSSIRGFQEIYESDMLLMPDPASAIIDPFYEQTTVSIICTVIDPITRDPYTRDPRYVATKAEQHLRSSGVADVCYFGPEAEFYVFDHVAFDQQANTAYYEVDSEEGHWTQGARLPAPRRGAGRARVQEPLAGGLLPRPAERHPRRPARGDGRHARGARDRHGVPSPRGRRPRAGGDRPALPAAA